MFFFSQINQRWRARWWDSKGKQHQRSFSVKRYEFSEAKRLAIEARRNAETEGARVQPVHRIPYHSSIPGVCYMTKAQGWLARYVPESGKRRVTQLYSVSKYGFDEAKRMAEDFRKAAEDQGLIGTGFLKQNKRSEFRASVVNDQPQSSRKRNRSADVTTKSSAMQPSRKRRRSE